jgi:hypothetical protein
MNTTWYLTGVSGFRATKSGLAQMRATGLNKKGQPKGYDICHLSFAFISPQKVSV